MPKIITENFKAETTKELFDSFDPSNSLYYVMGSVMTDEEDITNTQASTRNFLRKVIFGNKVESTEVRYLFPLTIWEQGKIYDAFDDTKDVSTLDMFAIVLGDGGNAAELNQSSYKVYKCIRNGLGQASTKTPSVSAVDDETLRGNDYQITLSDGYVWKFMFEVSPAEYIIYGTQDLLPLNFPGDVEVIASARESISDIKVEATQLNLFEKYAPFTYIDNEGGTGVRVETIVDTSQPIKKIRVTYPGIAGDRYIEPDSYKDMYLFTPNKGIIYEIKSSIAFDAGIQPTIELELENLDLANVSDILDLDFDLSSTKNYSIVPKIEVSRSSGNRCIAYGKLDTFGNLNDIVIIEGGTEYKFATAKVVIPEPLLQNELNPPIGYVKTVLRCIVSPKGGHGSNPVKEMAMSRLGIATTFSGASPIIPSTNSYTQVGLVKAPSFVSQTTPEQFDNRTKLTFSGSSLTAKIFPNYLIEQDVLDGSEIVETIVGQVHDIYYDERANIIDQNGSTVANPDFEKTVIFVVNNVGDFSAKFSTDPLTTNQSIRWKPDSVTAGDNVDYLINSVTDSDYIPYSGDLLHFVDFSPINRSEDRLEKIKFVFDF